jgi:HPt (histidine-containing phosphotransfer) domain-containing protein
MDTRSALARLGLAPEKYLRFLRRFTAGQQAALAELRTALNQGDLATARRHAHSMKGSSLTLGAEAIAASLEELESLLGEDSGSGWPALLLQVEQRLEALAEALARLPANEPGAAGSLDWPAVLEALEAFRHSLAEDDARAGHDLARLEDLLQGDPLQASLAPLKGWVEAYDFRSALECLPAFLAQVEALRG